LGVREREIKADIRPEIEVKVANAIAKRIEQDWTDEDCAGNLK
jgi:hypothetical protein